jgi:REP element-mobilizing transposase RayT
MRIYRRRLPHWDAPGAWVFVTWRLAGSLPAERPFHRDDLTSGEAFAVFDRLLDEGRFGPLYLQVPAVAQAVSDQLLVVEQRGECSLDSWVIMPNHVHVLWVPIVPLAELMRSVKGPTARQANLVLNRTGHAFWQQEYFDRLVRSGSEAEKIRSYIHDNPVRAGLASRVEDYRWSSAGSAALKRRAG